MSHFPGNHALLRTGPLGRIRARCFPISLLPGDSVCTPAMIRLQADGRRQILVGDKNYYGTQFEVTVDKAGIALFRPARKGEEPRPGNRFFKPLRQIIDAFNASSTSSNTAEASLQVSARVTRRLLAMTAANLHNDHIGATIRRTLTATTNPLERSFRRPDQSLCNRRRVVFWIISPFGLTPTII